MCEVTEQPSSEAKGNDKSEFGAILADVVTNMKVPITVLNVTLMGAFRSDAHVGAWSYPPTILDCSHWCLPGVPDAWNELIFSYLLTNGEFLVMLMSIFISVNPVGNVLSIRQNFHIGVNFAFMQGTMLFHCSYSIMNFQDLQSYIYNTLFSSAEPHGMPCIA